MEITLLVAQKNGKTAKVQKINLECHDQMRPDLLPVCGWTDEKVDRCPFAVTRWVLVFVYVDIIEYDLSI
jgi:hypothetical protein